MQGTEGPCASAQCSAAPQALSKMPHAQKASPQEALWASPPFRQLWPLEHHSAVSQSSDTIFTSSVISTDVKFSHLACQTVSSSVTSQCYYTTAYL